MATITIGVSVPAAAIAGPGFVYNYTGATPVAAQRVDAQTFSAAYAAEAAPVVRDSFGVETIIVPSTAAMTYSAVTGTLDAWPSATTVVNDGFGYRDGNEFHGGIDIMAPAGSPITASSPGIVTTVTEDGGWGAYVKIDHGGGIYTLYAHMISGSQTVSVGQTVNTGDVLGYVGDTGYATANLLHFEVYAGGTRVDPYGWLP